MQMPAWDDPELRAGGMVKGALWLVQCIGEGNTFTKNQLRQAFPGVSQIDRRIRDLRAYGWVILSNTEDAGLLSDDQRFVRTGVEVWDPAARRAAASHTSISNRLRSETLARDGYMCTRCGIAGGDNYPDDSYQTAVLLVTRRELPRDSGATALVTECKRCRAGKIDDSNNPDDVVEAVQRLDPADQRRFLRWIEHGRRPLAIERAWSDYLRLPASARDSVRQSLQQP